MVRKLKLVFTPEHTVESNKYPVLYIWYSYKQNNYVAKHIWQIFPLVLNRLEYYKKCGSLKNEYKHYIVSYTDGRTLFLKTREHAELILKDIDYAGYDNLCFGGMFDNFVSILCPFLFEIELMPSIAEECFIAYPVSIIDTEYLKEVHSDLIYLVKNKHRELIPILERSIEIAKEVALKRVFVKSR